MVVLEAGTGVMMRPPEMLHNCFIEDNSFQIPLERHPLNVLITALGCVSF